MDNFERRIRAAQGYSELGMAQDAIDELDALEAPERERPDILEMRLLIFLHAKRWKEALTVARKLCKLSPEASVGFIHAAFCLHELGRTDEAREILLTGPATLRNEPTYYYNLACYECAVGNLEGARAYLETSFKMDKKFREFAKIDPDLMRLRDEL